MSVRASIFTTSINFPASAIARRAEHEERRQQLIHHLRRVAYLATLEAYELESRAERSRVARLVERVDAELRRLCNPAGRAA